MAGGLSLAGYTLSHRLSADPDITVSKAERESGELPADREERAQEYHDSALFAKKVRPPLASQTEWLLQQTQRLWCRHQSGRARGARLRAFKSAAMQASCTAQQAVQCRHAFGWLQMCWSLASSPEQAVDPRTAWSIAPSMRPSQCVMAPALGAFAGPD